MATIDKTSVREQVEQLKQQFEQLRATGKVNDETQAVMNSLLLIVELILSIFLERKTRKNNRNSSIPSSQTDKDSTALPTSKSKGKGKRGRGTSKIPVFGILKRNGCVYTQIIKNATKSQVLPIIRKYVKTGSTVYTDKWRAYDGLVVDGYKHYRINHQDQQYLCHYRCVSRCHQTGP